MEEYIKERLSNIKDEDIKCLTEKSQEDYDYRYRKYHSLDNHYSDDYQEILDHQTLRNKKISKERSIRKLRLNHDNRNNIKRNNLNNCRTFSYRRQYYD